LDNIEGMRIVLGMSMAEAEAIHKEAEKKLGIKE
jgi:hypothetical protein